MLRIGLTGGIATGKSYVGRRLREAGVPLIDADVIAREVVRRGTPGLAAVVTRFGREILTPDGRLDRSRLGGIVFRDEAARRDLEAIVHPAVRRAIDAFFGELPAETPFAVADIPLLFEAGRARDFDKVIVVACAPHTQTKRVMVRDGLSREDAKRRVGAQLPIEDKARHADYVIRTDGTHAETDVQILSLLRQLRGEPSVVRPP